MPVDVAKRSVGISPVGRCEGPGESATHPPKRSGCGPARWHPHDHGVHAELSGQGFGIASVSAGRCDPTHPSGSLATRTISAIRRRYPEVGGQPASSETITIDHVPTFCGSVSVGASTRSA